MSLDECRWRIKPDFGADGSDIFWPGLDDIFILYVS